MDVLKKYMGLFWMALGPLMIVFMAWQAIEKISMAAAGIAKTNTMLQWTIILIIFIPICLGLSLFGWYAWKNEFKEKGSSA
jgi:hypothetical protein